MSEDFEYIVKIAGLIIKHNHGETSEAENPEFLATL